MLAGGGGQNVNNSGWIKSSPESIDSSAVLDHDGISILVNVAVLANPLVVARGFLLESDPVLLGVGRTELAVSHVEPLLLQDSGQAGVAIELGGSLAGAGQGQAL